jgi:hypothetical protein
MSNLIRDETREESEGFFELPDLIRDETREESEGFFELPDLIRDETVEEPSGSSTLVAQEGGLKTIDRKIR